MSIRSNVDRGGLDQRVQFSRNAVTGDGAEAVKDDWSDLGGEVWARVDAMKAGERFKDASISTVDAYTVWIRAEVYSDLGLVQRDRMTWKGRHFDIKDIPDQQLRGRLIAIFVQGGLNNG